MGLYITAIDSKKVSLVNPETVVNEPDELDFAYRNDRDAFERDYKEWEAMVTEYEEQTEQSIVGTINFGYGAFAGLRARIGDEIGFKHVQNGWDLSISYDDQAPYATELATFFQHSDCDGRLNDHILKVLDKVLKSHTEELKRLENDNVNKFVNFLRKSVKHDCYWKFG